ncbi:hypothetical protein LOTGIDRAFT_238415 [Lottia gigantea]|uniref:Uncharacterized protein n=1 Tax=Lottia gigantea TaxID=225164 RepID=V4CFW4_LOTGI|nr:hypothetical protein LOTGIDRAFT_238415 [Lottia gigantea]ESP00930.1 hypothetical protein LOTGIDRAFT_238415 [Lottia gigantea]
MATRLILFLCFFTIVSLADCLSNSTEVNHCQLDNPILGCYRNVAKEIFDAGEDVGRYCRAIKEYMSCSEKVACDCHLGNTDLVLREITRYVAVYKHYNCSKELKEDLQITPGITCPGESKDTYNIDEALRVLSLDTLPNVGILNQHCVGMKTCYKTLSDASSVALYSKNLTGFCSAIEDFLPCFEESACSCGQSQNMTFVLTIANERQAYNGYCSILTKGVFYEAGIKCPAITDICEQENPIYDCFKTFIKKVRPFRTDRSKSCPAYKEYIKCTENMACKCGLRNSVPVLHSLKSSFVGYEKMGCNKESGKLDLQFGASCPEGSPNYGSKGNEVVTSIGLMENDMVLAVIEHCEALKPCYFQLDSSTAKSFYKKEVDAMCQAQSDFIKCAEKAGCTCNKYKDTNFILFLIKQKYLHQQTCPQDIRVMKSFKPKCGSQSINKTSTVPCILIVFILFTLFFQ